MDRRPGFDYQCATCRRRQRSPLVSPGWVSPTEVKRLPSFAHAWRLLRSMVLSPACRRQLSALYGGQIDRTIRLTTSDQRIFVEIYSVMPLLAVRSRGQVHQRSCISAAECEGGKGCNFMGTLFQYYRRHERALKGLRLCCFVFLEKNLSNSVDILCYSLQLSLSLGGGSRNVNTPNIMG